jgi:TRAP-type C4-dicarboxylate transport system permease small subunit
MYGLFCKFFAAFQKFVLGLITVALMLMMVVIAVQVFTRYVIFYSLPWSEELSRYLFVFIVLCGINIAVSKEKLIKIDALQNSIKSLRGRLALDIVHAIAGIIACALIALYCTDLFPVGRVQKSPAMRIPMIIMYYVVFIGYVLALIALVLKLVEKIKAITDPKTKGVTISASDDIKAAMEGGNNGE